MGRQGAFSDVFCGLTQRNGLSRVLEYRSFMVALRPTFVVLRGHTDILVGRVMDRIQHALF
jgi:hypothetical protein